MKLWPATKLEIFAQQIFDDKVMLTNCDVIAIFPIYGRFGEIQRAKFRINELQNLHFH